VEDRIFIHENFGPHCGGIFSNHVIANYIENVPVKEFWLKIGQYLAKIMDSDKVGRFI